MDQLREKVALAGVSEFAEVASLLNVDLQTSLSDYSALTQDSDHPNIYSGISSKDVRCVLKKRVLVDAKTLARFMNEKEMLKRLSGHPLIVPLHKAFIDNDSGFLELPYYEVPFSLCFFFFSFNRLFSFFSPSLLFLLSLFRDDLSTSGPLVSLERD